MDKKLESQIIDDANLCFVCAELSMRFAAKLPDSYFRQLAKQALKPFRDAAKKLTKIMNNAFRKMDIHYETIGYEENFDSIVDFYESEFLKFAIILHEKTVNQKELESKLAESQNQIELELSQNKDV